MCKESTYLVGHSSCQEHASGLQKPNGAQWRPSRHTQGKATVSPETLMNQARGLGMGLRSSPAVSVAAGRHSGSLALGSAGCTKSMTSPGSEVPEALSSRVPGEWQCRPLSHSTCSSKSSSRESMVSSKNRMTSFSSCVRYFRLSSSYRHRRDKTNSSQSGEKK